jgi:hypothetical protein
MAEVESKQEKTAKFKEFEAKLRAERRARKHAARGEEGAEAPAVQDDQGPGEGKAPSQPAGEKQERPGELILLCVVLICVARCRLMSGVLSVEGCGVGVGVA